ncbi:MAG: cytochrome c oxidase subunit I [Myxococcota bacterium]|nr:cytochrome c oxidase subunit I [Myxococcota bacterium]
MREAPPDALERALRETWSQPRGIIAFLTNVNHRAVGTRFMVTAFVFFLLGGIEALIMRVQLASPSADVIGPETYDQLFTMHGSTMMFLFAVPFLEGLAIYVVPLMIGTRDMAFPRLNAFGYWVYLIAGVALHVALLAGLAPNAGWFNYVPLAGPSYSPGVNIDYWVTMVTFIEVSALAAAVELIVTILKQRAPGMALHRMPVFVWAMLITALMIVFAMPPLIVTSLMLGLDRLAGTHFFHALAGGEPLLWQHLFWFFGHPDVYIMLVPALGIVSAIVPASVRRPLAGYGLVTGSLVAIGIISFGLWVHHMYAAGLPLLGMSFFAAASMMITVPTSIILVSWIYTIAKGRPRFDTAFLFVLGFVATFILGGITGIMVASVPLDWQVHDTFFVVAHFHYVLIGGVVFPIFGALHFWFPKVTGRVLGERLGKASFWTIFVGFHGAFFPMHVLGLLGMPRRVYTYLPGLGWEALNLFVTVCAFVLGLGVLLVLINIVAALLSRERAGADPWHAPTLEWATSSPPPLYNFAHIPVVRSREPLWHDALRGRSISVPIDDPHDVRREVLVTSMLDAAPESRLALPGPSMWPALLAFTLAAGLLGAIVDLVFVPIGGVLAALVLVGWHWPERGARARAIADDRRPTADAEEGPR